MLEQHNASVIGSSKKNHCTHLHMIRKLLHGSKICWSWFHNPAASCRWKQIAHKRDVSYGQPQGLNPGQSFLISKGRHLKVWHCSKFKTKNIWIFQTGQLERDSFFSTFVLSLSKASFRLNILRLSRMLAALRWAILATRRLFLLDFFITPPPPLTPEFPWLPLLKLNSHGIERQVAK